MAVKLELYRIFRTVAEEESISAAAKTLFISQSAVSQSIHQLEEQLQVRLFSRQPRGVTLTGEGRVLYDYVRSAISLIETGEEKVQQTRELMMGELVMPYSTIVEMGEDGVTYDILYDVLIKQNGEIHSDWTGVKMDVDAYRKVVYEPYDLKVLNGTSYEALQMLRAGQVDLAFASTPQESGNLQMRRCMALHNVFVAGRDYPCETDRAYTLAELSRFPLMLLERKSSARRYLERFFTRNGITLKPEIELCSHELLVDLAAIGLGVACVTRDVVSIGTYFTRVGIH